MPKYAILRTQKLKSLHAIRRSLRHSFREQDTPNADPKKSAENEHIGADTAAEALLKINERLPDKRRKDAVLAIEYLITGSPEVINSMTREQQDAYFADAFTWLVERHGAANVAYAGVHRDESTPHMYCYVVPLDDATGRLNCRKWLGGARALSQMQTDFADRVASAHGLQRGIEGSKAKHQSVKRFYSSLRAVDDFTITKSDLVKKTGFFTRHKTPEEIESILGYIVRASRHQALEYQRIKPAYESLLVSHGELRAGFDNLTEKHKEKSQESALIASERDVLKKEVLDMQVKLKEAEKARYEACRDVRAADIDILSLKQQLEREKNRNAQLERERLEKENAQKQSFIQNNLAEMNEKAVKVNPVSLDKYLKNKKPSGGMANS